MSYIVGATCKSIIKYLLICKSPFYALLNFGPVKIYPADPDVLDMDPPENWIKYQMQTGISINKILNNCI